jgi:hypothetical protein
MPSRAGGVCHPVEKGVKDHRNHRRQRVTQLQQRLQGVRQLAKEVGRHHRDHAKAHRKRHHVDMQAIAIESGVAKRCRRQGGVLSSRLAPWPGGRRPN